MIIGLMIMGHAMASMTFFKHDLDARNDPSVLAIRSRYGMTGYATLFCLYELIYAEGKPLDMSVDWKAAAIAREVEMEPEALDLFIGDCVDVGLFEAEWWEKHRLISERCAHEMNYVSELSEKRRQAGVESGKTRRNRAK